MARLVIGDHERELIAARLSASADTSYTTIAAELGCHRATVSRDANANGGRHNYRPIRSAKRQTLDLNRTRPSKLVADTTLKARVETELTDGRSPEAITADLRAEGSTVCHETIYHAVYGDELDVDAKVVLHRRKRCRLHRQPHPP